MKINITLLSIFLFAGIQLTYAGSATWRADAQNKRWVNSSNWTPATVPNGPADTATFGKSSATVVALSRGSIELDRIVFEPAASAFSFTVRNAGSLLLSGFGIENDSRTIQTFVIGSGVLDTLAFTNQATAGAQTVFTVVGDGTVLNFYNDASADSGVFTIEPSSGGIPPQLLFRDNSTAANASFTSLGGLGNQSDGGDTVFHDLATAATAVFLNKGGTQGASSGGKTWFYGNCTAGEAVITNEGGASDLVAGGATFFMDNATADNALIVCNGAQTASNGFGQLYFNEISLGGSAMLIANPGSNGGSGGLIQFNDSSDGEQARIGLFGNGTLDIGGSDRGRITIGSLEGDGIVLLGAIRLTLGGNNLSTVFTGVIQEDGAMTKQGSGTLTLSGANTYTGGTIVNEGSLNVNNRSGSATGGGIIQVNGGMLSGGGFISGPVTVGSGSGPGAVLAPGNGSTTMTLRSTVTFRADGSYDWRLKTVPARADKVVANGVTIESGAQFEAIAVGNAQLPDGTSFVAINNTAATPIAGSFDNLPDGGTVSLGSNTLQADYQGGDGNDLTLTVVPQSRKQDRLVSGAFFSDAETVR